MAEEVANDLDVAVRLVEHRHVRIHARFSPGIEQVEPGDPFGGADVDRSVQPGDERLHDVRLPRVLGPPVHVNETENLVRGRGRIVGKWKPPSLGQYYNPGRQGRFTLRDPGRLLPDRDP